MYEQMKKNTVASDNQVQSRVFSGGEFEGNGGLRVLFAGNSITRHGSKPDIGWTGNHGMAASTPEKDYVHLLMAKIREKHPDAEFRIAQVADWERNYKNPAPVMAAYAAAREFRPELVVMMCGGNCPAQDFDDAAFQESLENLIRYFNPDGTAKTVLGSCFWAHPTNPGRLAVSRKLGIPFADMSDLGELDEMKAIGLFEHSGVANHPGDAGMQALADRFWNLIKDLI